MIFHKKYIVPLLFSCVIWSVGFGVIPVNAADSGRQPMADDYCVDDNGDRIVPDPDADGDGVLDCYDCCPNDPNKTDTDVCGCGKPDTDTDLDGYPDCIEACDNDPYKTTPGLCGCGEPDTDMDGDGTPNCLDVCFEDPDKITPGTCDCGVPDTDVDNDGVPDCKDGCLHDPNKSAPGLCGCGVVDSDTDTDGDGIIDCNDQCPDDANKVSPDSCGCGIADIDTDGDGTLDCHDGCSEDATKTVPGTCGCGVADTDSDGDGTADCHDICSQDPAKSEPGACGCGVADTDADDNGIADCLEQTGGAPDPFPWILFMQNFRSPCGETPTYCYMVADGDNYNSENSAFLKYDFETGKLDLIGRLGVGMVEAIAIGPDGETLYAANEGTLGIINTTTGAFTPIKPGGIGSGNGALGLITFDDIDALSFDPTTNILYGSNRRYDGQPHGVDLLVKIDHVKGEVIKGGFGPGLDYVIIDTSGVNLFDTDDLAFDTRGNLYGIATISGGGGGDRLMVIDKLSGRIIDHGALQNNGAPVQDMEGLTFYHGNILYGTTGYEFALQGTSNSLYKLNSATGAAQSVLRLDRSFNGYVPKDFEAIACPVCR